MKTAIIICLFGTLWFGCNHSSVGPEPGPVANTATYRLSDVNSLAASYGKGLRLMTVISSNVNIDGSSATWQYSYVDILMPQTSYWFHCSSDRVQFDSTSSTGVGSAIISETWINSDSAMYFADQNLGSQFRAANPHHTIVAYLSEPLVPNPTAFWFVTYRSNDDQSKFLALRVNAHSGEVVAMNN